MLFFFPPSSSPLHVPSNFFWGGVFGHARARTLVCSRWCAHARVLLCHRRGQRGFALSLRPLTPLTLPRSRGPPGPARCGDARGSGASPAPALPTRFLGKAQGAQQRVHGGAGGGQGVPTLGVPNHDPTGAMAVTSVQGFGGGGRAALAPHLDASLEHQHQLSGASVPSGGAQGSCRTPPELQDSANQPLRL